MFILCSAKGVGGRCGGSKWRVVVAQLGMWWLSLSCGGSKLRGGGSIRDIATNWGCEGLEWRCSSWRCRDSKWRCGGSIGNVAQNG